MLTTERLQGLLSPAFFEALEVPLELTEEARLDAAPLSMSDEARTRAVEQLLADGYFKTEPVIAPDVITPLRQSVEQVVAADLPATFALVYDEFSSLLGSLFQPLEAVLGAGHRLVPDLYIWHVPAGEGHSGFAPHRDEPERPMSASARDDGCPVRLTIWIPLSHATPENSCMYVIPKSVDPGYHPIARRRPGAAPHMRDARALPAPAGSILGWGPHLLHWGSPSSRWAGGPRISLGATYAIPEVAGAVSLGPNDRLTYAQRLGLIARGLLKYHRNRFSDHLNDELLELCVCSGFADE